MGTDTKIEWTEHTFNTWWGCARVSPACVNCYADSLAHRWGQELWRRKGPRRFMADAYWRKPLAWNCAAEEAGKPAMVFCASMADVFEDHPVPEVHAQQDAARARLWELIGQTPWLRWQLLTKRPENVPDMVPWVDDWPTNVWLGASAENQRWADERSELLLRVPAKVRFLSCEPLLGETMLHALYGHAPWHYTEFGVICSCGMPMDADENCRHGDKIHWIIAGGESGPHARPMNPDWVRSIRDQCAETGTAFLFKQWGGRTPKAGGRLLDGRTHDDYPWRCPHDHRPRRPGWRHARRPVRTPPPAAT